MEHRGVDIKVLQALGQSAWRWYLAIDGIWLTGEAATQDDAVTEARKAIDQVLGQAGE